MFYMTKTERKLLDDKMGYNRSSKIYSKNLDTD